MKAPRGRAIAALPRLLAAPTYLHIPFTTPNTPPHPLHYP